MPQDDEAAEEVQHDLSLVPTEQLVNELGDRFQDGFVLLTEWDGEGNSPLYSRVCRGPISRVWAMLQRGERFVRQQVFEIDDRGDDGDE